MVGRARRRPGELWRNTLERVWREIGARDGEEGLGLRTSSLRLRGGRAAVLGCRAALRRGGAECKPQALRSSRLKPRYCSGEHQVRRVRLDFLAYVVEQSPFLGVVGWTWLYKSSRLGSH